MSGSRYGNGRVDIGAPGQNIPYLSPSGSIEFGNGTSEAAIVSGIISVMRSCSPSSSAQEIKKILLDSADTYENLKEYITDGRVLNAGSAIKRVCTNLNKKDMEEVQLPNEFLNNKNIKLNVSTAGKYNRCVNIYNNNLLIDE